MATIFLIVPSVSFIIYPDVLSHCFLSKADV
jgi:hypothetical protein